MLKVLINNNQFFVERCNIKQRLNSISSAEIFLTDDNDDINFFDNVKILYNKQIIFNGIIVEINKTYENSNNIELFCCDKLYLLKTKIISGGIYGVVGDLLTELCNEIGITNTINNNKLYTYYYSDEINKFELLKNLCKFAYINFYYHPPTNQLRDFSKEYENIKELKYITKIKSVIKDDIINRIMITNEIR